MTPEQAQGVAKLVEFLKTQNDVLALILGGSIAKGTARQDSDIDVLIVLIEEEFQRRKSIPDVIFLSWDFTDYPGGYVDGKYIGKSFLIAVADHGSEPARSAFVGASVPWSRDPDVINLVHQASLYPLHEQSEKMASFVSRLNGFKWYVGEAEKRHDEYLMGFCVQNTILFACRLILAHNQIIYPYHKWLMKFTEDAPEKPDGMMEKINILQKEPSREHLHHLADCVLNYREWPSPGLIWANRWILEEEWGWMEGRVSLENS